MNKTILQGKWRQMRGNLKMEWAKLRDDDRRMFEGKLDQMVGLLQERYGHTQESASKTLSHYLSGFETSSQKPVITADQTQRVAWVAAEALAIGLGAWFFYRRVTTALEMFNQSETSDEGITSPEAILG